MNLLDIANHVCERLGSTDADSVTQAKKFARRRYQQVYDAQAWAEGMGAVEVTTDASGIAVVPHLSHIWQVRKGSSGAAHVLEQVDRQRVLLIAPDALDEAGEPVAWSEIEPVGALRQPTQQDYFSVDSSSPADNQQVRLVVSDPTDGRFATSRLDLTVTLAGTTPITVADDGTPLGYVSTILQFSKPETQGNVRIYEPIINGVMQTLRPNELTQRFPRVQLMRDPEEATSLVVFGKLKCVPLLHDADTPALSGIDDLLCAFVTGDMLEREQQYGKANIKFQEANGLLAGRIQAERTLKGNRIQLVPSVVNYSERDLIY